MADTPTNQRIAEMLERVLSELEDIRKTQDRLSTAVRAAVAK